jgi:hypothetical protein
MSVRCPDCGAVASYGHELGHRSDCPSLRKRAEVDIWDGLLRRRAREYVERGMSHEEAEDRAATEIRREIRQS